MAGPGAAEGSPHPNPPRAAQTAARFGARHPGLRYLGAVLALAALYAIVGRLGLLLAIPPGYSVAVWPPAGLALAAMLTGGRRLWPGVLLGSFLVNMTTGWEAIDTVGLLRGMAVAAVIAGGAAAQAALAATLIRRYVPRPDFIAQDASVVRMLLLGGPASCLLNATIATTTLWAVGLIPDSTVLFNWATWWVGDSVGVILFLPFLLVWLLPSVHRRRRQQLLVTVPLLVMFVLVVGLFVLVTQREKQRLDLQLQSAARANADRLQRALEEHLGILQALRRFYQSSEGVTADEFRHYAEELLSTLPGVKALAWSVQLDAAARDAYVAARRREHGPAYTLHDADGSPAPQRPQHVAIHYVVPGALQARVLGFDLASESGRRQAIEAARDSGRAIATAAVQLVHEPVERHSIIAFMPVYRQDAPLRDVSERRAAVLGYVSTVFTIDDILRDVFADLEQGGLRYRLADISAGAPGSMLSRSAQFDLSDPYALRHTAEVEWAGRHWRLDFILPGSYLVAHRSWEAWSLLAGGLLFTGLLGTLLLVMVGRQAQVQALVARQTAEIRRGEERFRGLLENAPDALVIVDRAGRIEFVNAQAERLFGYARAELIAGPVELLLPAALRDRHIDHRADYFSQPLARPMGAGLPLRARRKDGSEFPAEISLGPMRFGEEQYVTATVRDISERLQVQEQLAQYADKLKRSNEELEQFAYVASHDLKAPLRGVIGFSQLLQRRLAGKLEPETSDYLQHIVAGGQHMQALISDLLLFASIGRTGEPMVAVDCEQVLADVRARLRGIIEERSVQLSHEPLPTVLGTPLELMQLLQNLIGNAIKFQPGERPRVHLSARREEGYWRFAVRDEGIGIPPEQQQRIFKIFQRLHTSDRYEGTGVGLSICQKIVQRHGGRIWAESAPGAGATFYFTLPAVADAATA